MEMTMLCQRTCTLVFLFEDERRILMSVVDDRHLSPKTRLRAQALLLTDRVKHPTTTDVSVADETGLSRGTISNLRKRYTKRGLTQAIKPLLTETDRMEMAMRLQSSQSSFFNHFVARRRGSFI